MIYYILENHLRKFMFETLGFYSWEEVLLRSLLSMLTSLLLSLWLGPKVIRWLKKKKIGDCPNFDHDILNQKNSHKDQTPTMGGILILLSILISTLLWADLSNQYVIKAIVVIIWLGGLGSIDDWLKLTQATKNRSRDGLLSWEKIMFQMGLGALVGIFLYQFDFKNIEDGQKLWIPFCKTGFDIGFFGFMAISIIVITGTSNAVNLTDGMDGLASGSVAIVAIVLAVLCYLASEPLSISNNQSWASYLRLPQIPGAGELSIVCTAMLGACFGFLWYNCYPAEVFMGDTGSLPLGGLIGYTAIVTRHELLLIILGGVFVIEAASVIIQVTYFKRTGGKKIFKCSPIHHHFHLIGWSEPKVVVRFWLVCIAFATLALATLKLR